MNAFPLTRTPERLAALAAATMMTLVVMAGISALADIEPAAGMQALSAPAAPVVQQVLVIGQRAPRS